MPFLSYQQFIENHVEQIIDHFDCAGYRTSGPANQYRLMIVDDTETLLTLRFDFQSTRVHVLLDGADLGPRSAQVFWWEPGKAEDDAEVNRFFRVLGERLRAVRGA